MAPTSKGTTKLLGHYTWIFDSVGSVPLTPHVVQSHLYILLPGHHVMITLRKFNSDSKAYTSQNKVSLIVAIITCIM